MAVYTALSHAEIADFLKPYHVGELAHFQGIAEGIENTNYLIMTSSSGRGEGQAGKYILTIYERRVQTKDLPYFLALTEWLADRGIRCPRPVHSSGGATVRMLKHKPAALIHFLEGKNNPEITPAHMTQVGETMARMHLAAEGLPMVRRNALSLEGWQELFRKFRHRADEIAPGLEDEIARELCWLAGYWPHGLPSGPIHADIFPDNVFFKPGSDGQPKLSGIIDFYFACDDFWLYDLLICMNAWCFDAQHRFVPERAGALLHAYNHLRPLTQREKEAMPVLARGAAMRFLMTRCYDGLNRVDGALVTPKDPMEYVAKLRFHQQDDQMTRLLDN